MQQCAVAAQRANGILGVHQKRDGQQGEGSDCIPLVFFPHEVPSELLHPALGPPAQERWGAGPDKCLESNQRGCSSSPMNIATGLVQL